MPNVFSRIFGKKRNKKTEDEDGGEGDAREALETSASDGIGPLSVRDDCEGDASGIDLIFVHGLRGSRLKTWSSGDVFWPRDFLKDDVKNARVITWGYDASVANAFAYASKESIFGHADTLLNDLARLRKRITRPIVFICHSLGGLVVKAALIESAAYNSHKRHPTLGEIYASTIGVIFLGTPHRGSSKENLGEVVANVAKLSFRQPNKQLLATLKTDSHILENQRDQFTTISSNLSIIVKEASASYDGFNVRRDAINANHMNMVKFPSKGNEGYKRTLGHVDDIRNVQRPEIQQENEKIESRNNDILKALEFSKIHDRELNIDNAYADTCSWILDHQSTNNKASAKPSQFLSWLKNNETFFWISGKAGCGKSTLMKYVYQNRKTREDLSQWADGKDLVLTGYFFFDRGDKDQSSREGMLRSILHQVLSTRRDLIPKVFSQFFGNTLPLQQFMAWTNLSGALISMLDHLRDSKICLFLDGLDEYRMIDRIDEYTEEEMDLIYDGTNEDDAWGQSIWITDGHREIARFLRQFKNCDNIKVCISSRELVVFEQEFRTFPRLQVHEHTAESIAHYCDNRLTDEAPGLIHRSDFVSLITEKARGVFLWVRLVVDMLVNGYNDGNFKEELLKILDNLPPRLGGKDGLYMRMMRNIKREYLPESKRLFQLVMRWGEHEALGSLDIITLFLAEPGHLEADSEQELRARNDKVLLKSWGEWRPRWTDLERRLKSRCGGLLEGIENVQFMHQTAKEFMSRNYLWDKIFHNTAGFGGSDLNLAMLSGLVRRLKCCGEAAFKSNGLQSQREQDPAVLSYPFKNLEIPTRGFELLECALCHANSLESCDRFDQYVALLDELDGAGDQLTRDWKDGLAESFRRSSVANASWVEFFIALDLGGSSKWPNLASLKPKSFLELAITRNLFPYVEVKIRCKDIPRPQLQSLLLRATRRVLLEWKDQGYLYAAYNSPEISEMLFQKGADPNCRDADSNTVMPLEEGLTAWTGLLQDRLHVGSFGDAWVERWILTVKVFLKYGADPTVRWYSPHGMENGRAMEINTPDTIIQAVSARQPQCQKGFADIMELLSEAKANLGPIRGGG
ncbi:uncharacterized protein PAC_01293 [Phialocephala subalpina]|uniref:NACHT domain-containing protein n=1 Tax=Phialocephala subalpina TaxID=576137 RepID=A0A1L7WF63_9HELO|nr:uncharacterized protein PAC_01293 [Phialocephala subalpina]